jgi:hypothetical protein
MDRLHGPLEDRPVELEAGRPPVPREVPGPGRLDLLSGQPRPLACVALAEARLELDVEADGAAQDLGGPPRPLQVGRDDRVDRREG